MCHSSLNSVALMALLLLNHSPPTFDLSLPELDWDFDISTLLGQNIPAGETGLDLGHYFDFDQPFIPISPDDAT